MAGMEASRQRAVEGYRIRSEHWREEIPDRIWSNKQYPSFKKLIILS